MRATTPIQASKSEKPKSSPASGFGLLVLLLAALPFNESDGNAVDSTECPRARPTLATASNLRYAATMMDDVTRAGQHLLTPDADDDLDDDELDRRRRKRALARGQFSDSEEELSSSPGFTDELASISGCSDDSAPHHSFSELKAELLSEIMGYLPLEAINRCRQINTQWNHVTKTIASTPLQGACFLRFNKESHRGTRFEIPPPRHLMRWICNFCATANTVGIGSCRQCSGGCADALGIRRVFIGQLRKERTIELVEWLLATIYPDMEVFHIENHTSPKDGRGKGCCWVYVTSAADEKKLLALNKRMFIDIDGDKREGVWYVESAGKDQLGTMASTRAYKSNRPQVLPRQPLVAERPATKALPAFKPKPTYQYQPSWSQCSATAEELYAQLSPAYYYDASRTAPKVWSHDPYGFQAVASEADEPSYYW